MLVNLTYASYVDYYVDTETGEVLRVEYKKPNDFEQFTHSSTRDRIEYRKAVDILKNKESDPHNECFK